MGMPSDATAWSRLCCARSQNVAGRRLSACAHVYSSMCTRACVLEHVYSRCFARQTCKSCRHAGPIASLWRSGPHARQRACRRHRTGSVGSWRDRTAFAPSARFSAAAPPFTFRLGAGPRVKAADLTHLCHTLPCGRSLRQLAMTPAALLCCAGWPCAPDRANEGSEPAMREFYVKPGDSVTFAKTVGETDIYLFAGITGDFAVNHVNEQYMA